MFVGTLYILLCMSLLEKVGILYCLIAKVLMRPKWPKVAGLAQKICTL